jgi:hypothetical protein
LTSLGASVAGVLVKKIPSTAVSTLVYKTGEFVHGSLPISHSKYGKQDFILINGKEQLELDNCPSSLYYLFRILINSNIPFEERKTVSNDILMNRLDLSTREGRIQFLFCMISILLLFAQYNPSSFLIMMQNLVRAIKTGRISKQLARFIVKKLLKKNIVVDPQLLELTGLE